MKSDDILRGLYKAASFAVQAIAFKETGDYICHQKELLQFVSNDEQIIVNNMLFSIYALFLYESR